MPGDLGHFSGRVGVFELFDDPAALGDRSDDQKFVFALFLGISHKRAVRRKSETIFRLVDD